MIESHAAVTFLLEAALYFEKREIKGEDSSHWANTANAETCRRIAELIEGLATQERDYRNLTRSLLDVGGGASVGISAKKSHAR